MVRNAGTGVDDGLGFVAVLALVGAVGGVLGLRTPVVPASLSAVPVRSRVVFDEANLKVVVATSELKKIRCD